MTVLDETAPPAAASHARAQSIALRNIEVIGHEIEQRHPANNSRLLLKIGLLMASLPILSGIWSLAHEEATNHTATIGAVKRPATALVAELAVTGAFAFAENRHHP